jgi:predicted ester cyclase
MKELVNKAAEKTLHDFYRNYIAAANARDFAAIANVVAEQVTLNGVAVNREDIISQFKILVDAVPSVVTFFSTTTFVVSTRSGGSGCVAIVPPHTPSFG